jgi:replicative DNA helicase
MNMHSRFEDQMAAMRSARDADPRQVKELPNNVEAEQALLGALLVNNEALDVIRVPLTPAHFFEPIHGEVFEAINTLVKAGRRASPVTIKALVTDHQIGDMTVAQYLAALASNAVSVVNTPDYALSIIEQAARRACLSLSQKMESVGYSAELDIMDDFEALRAKFEEVSAALRGEEKTGTLAEAATRALASTAKAHAGSGMVGIDYGFTPLMNMIGPMLPGQLIIVGGATKQGKSTLIEQIVAGSAMNGHAAWVMSGEMGAEELAHRALSRLTDIQAWKQIRGKVSQTEYEKLDTARRYAETWQNRVFIRDDSMTLRQIRREVTLFAKLHPNGIAVVDHIGLVERDSSNQRVEDAQFAPVVTKALKMLARDAKIPIIAAAQLKKNTFEVTDRKMDRKTYLAAISRRPKYGDIFGSVEKDANHVILPFRAEPILQELEPAEASELHPIWEEIMDGVRNKAEIVLALSRHTRWPQRKEVNWNGPKTMFEEIGQSDQGRML